MKHTRFVMSRRTVDKLVLSASIVSFGARVGDPAIQATSISVWR